MIHTVGTAPHSSPIPVAIDRDLTNNYPIITGRGMYLPEDILTNDDIASAANPELLAAWVQENGWCQSAFATMRAEGYAGDSADVELHRQLFCRFIAERIGIQVRHVVDRGAILERRAPNTNIYGSDLGAHAARAALADAGVDASEIDLIVCATSSPDRIFPTTAVEIQQKIGAQNAYAYDLLAACTSFVFGLETVRGLVLSGLSRRALLISPEYFSCSVDYRDPRNSFFWGDAAAAVVVEASDLGRKKGGYELHAGRCHSHFSENIKTGLGGTRAFWASANGNGSRFAGANGPKPGEEGYPFFFQNGPTVYREVVPLVNRAIGELLSSRGLTVEDVRVFMFHQASTPIIEGIAKRLFRDGVADERISVNLKTHGNTSSCGVALCLVEESILEAGDLACLAAFGAGYTVGAILIRRIAAE